MFFLQVDLYGLILFYALLKFLLLYDGSSGVLSSDFTQSSVETFSHLEVLPMGTHPPRCSFGSNEE